MPSRRRSVAVIGSGVAGLTAAYVLAKHDRVTLYEADKRLGGHAHTHRLTLDTGQHVAIDTGFIVHNDRTYPTLLRLFGELGVQTQESDMSMSVRSEASGLEYAGAKGGAGLFPTPRTATNGRYLVMLGEVVRFHRHARALLAEPTEPGARSDNIAQFLARHKFSGFFVEHFMRPLIAAVWSCDPEVADEYPAKYLFTFLEHHGMLTVFGSPTWRTVTGGSVNYVEKIAARIHEVRTGVAVRRVIDSHDGVKLVDERGEARTYDAVVVATHPHQAASMLANPSAKTVDVLRAIPYVQNHVQLHTDSSVLPTAPKARASWNYLIPAHPTSGVVVTYDLTRLMRIDTVTDRRFLVTLGGSDRVDPASVIAEMTYEHPVYTPSSVAAQGRLHEIGTSRIAFAGAYHGWGFHEDGALSGLRAAERIGGSWDADTDAPRNIVELHGVPS
ncbi:NAD(P)/FAD-dependent oxidoreductase [Antrihabitans sp. YC2-6]|uniref:NAD(P)/FAD-dependent oxidoreductase n=1 Tax=Antrihabitans sp. YC2-6 TaxID=2799498 RepID=UPI0018F2AE85|nr:FAD-dependent oxidoreductase [Antrihabitans sp. YC2-6]MBJ8346776.1 FAD-dependent oxidoreductase [Antrihabitans sp. YC2-6]